jgi:type II secretory pathway component PulF
LSGSSAGAVTLDQLIALSDEMAALVRAGVPLDRGLVAAGRDLRGRAGRLAARLGERLERGEGLAEALEGDGASVPPFYRAVIEAGLRSGRLSKALEGLASYARSFAETRRAIGLALLYPMLVLLLAYGLFLMFSVWVAPRLIESFAMFRFGVPRLLGATVWLGDHPRYWAPVVPAALAGLVVAWVMSGRASALRPGRLTGLIRLVPGMRSVLDLAQTADFADLMALMIEHDVPLEQALGLAAEATGSPRLRASAEAVAGRLRGGDPDGEAVAGPGGLPPMLSWVIATAGARGPLAPALRHAAATYRNRAARRAEALQALLPSVLLCAVGAEAGIIYVGAVFTPVIALWRDLALPMSD